MEQPEIYRPEQYAKVVSSMQPVYGQTKGLGNKTIAKAVTEALTMRQMEREYLVCGKSTDWRKSTMRWSTSIFQQTGKN